MEKTGEDLEIGFNSKYVIDVLKAVSDEQVLSAVQYQYNPLSGKTFDWKYIRISDPSSKNSIKLLIMYIKEIQLKDFRNYEQLTAEFHKNVNIFLGQNAQGKAHLLESIYITSMGKSFRTNKDREMIRFGEDFFRVRVKAFKEEELVVEIAVNQGRKKGH